MSEVLSVPVPKGRLHVQVPGVRHRQAPLDSVVNPRMMAKEILQHQRRVGKGPVVRLGDRRSIFDSGASQLLSMLADKVLPGRHQRRLMDGGACEATAATAWGLPTIGITLPLGNYHNQGFEGGMDCPKPEGPAPEFVHLDDIDGELRLCRALMQRGIKWSDPWSTTRLRLLKNANHYKSLF